MELKSIGLIHSPYKNRKDCPPQGREEICWIEVFEEYKEGLKDIDAKPNARNGWVKSTDFSKVYGKSLKESKHVQ